MTKDIPAGAASSSWAICSASDNPGSILKFTRWYEQQKATRLTFRSHLSIWFGESSVCVTIARSRRWSGLGMTKGDGQLVLAVSLTSSRRWVVDLQKIFCRRAPAITWSLSINKFKHGWHVFSEHLLIISTFSWLHAFWIPLLFRPRWRTKYEHDATLPRKPLNCLQFMWLLQWDVHWAPQDTRASE